MIIVKILIKMDDYLIKGLFMVLEDQFFLNFSFRFSKKGFVFLLFLRFLSLDFFRHFLSCSLPFTNTILAEIPTCPLKNSSLPAMLKFGM